VPEFYGELTNLRTLDLGHNALRSVPDLDALTQLAGDTDHRGAPRSDGRVATQLGSRGHLRIDAVLL
jgi:hypothetical protein